MFTQATLESHSANPLAIDPHEFSARAEVYRRELLAHCYRMVGSVEEADRSPGLVPRFGLPLTMPI